MLHLPGLTGAGMFRGLAYNSHSESEAHSHRPERHAAYETRAMLVVCRSKLVGENLVLSCHVTIIADINIRHGKKGCWRKDTFTSKFTSAP